MPHVDLYPLTASGLSAPSGCESCPCPDLASVFTRTPCGFVRTKVEGQKIIMVNYLPAYLNSIFSGFGSGAHNSSDCRQEVLEIMLYSNTRQECYVTSHISATCSHRVLGL